MKISHKDKMLLFEQEFTTLLFIIVLGFIFSAFQANLIFYLLVLGIGFIIYFWMVHEEEIHITGVKHLYFEHTSSYVMVAQTALALELLSLNFLTQNPGSAFLKYFMLICMIISVIMYSVSLSRIVLFKLVFKGNKK